MIKNFKKVLSVVLAGATLLCMAIPSFAADITTNGGSASAPVKLWTTDDGTFDGEPSATVMSLTAPTSFPVAAGTTGNISVANNVKITNNSYGAVRVKSVSITAGTGWNLTAFGDKSTLASEKVDSNKVGFAMKLGAGSQVKTTGTGNTQTLISTPVTGCYMSGVGDTTKNSVPITYDAIVTPVSKAITDVAIASVTFVVEFDTVA